MFCSWTRSFVCSAFVLASFGYLGHALKVNSEGQSMKTNTTKVDSNGGTNGGTYWSGKLAAATVQHPTEDCYSACGSKGGYCNWCGTGNACCRLDYEDASECARSTGFTQANYHECVGVEKENQTKPTLSWHMLDRFILVPEHNLLFCYIEKVACTSFNDLFAGLRKRYDSSMIHTRKVQGWFQNDPYHRGYTKEDIENILVNRTWHKAVFYRDPVERFVSAYRSKCEGQDTDGRWVCAESFGSPVASFPLAVHRIKELDARNNPEDDFKLNVHLRHQSSFCGGLQNTLQYYNTVEQLNTKTARNKVIKLLDDVGADYTWISNFDEIFPPEEGSGSVMLQDEHRTQQKEHNTNTLEHLREYFPTKHPETLDVLVKHYENDYAAFKLSPPTVMATDLPVSAEVVNTSPMTALGSAEKHEEAAPALAEVHNAFAVKEAEHSSSYPKLNFSSMKQLEEELFHRGDSDKSGTVSLSEFENIFDEALGRVTEKIMSNSKLANSLVLSHGPLKKWH